jgi:hypothetical protein
MILATNRPGAYSIGNDTAAIKRAAQARKQWVALVAKYPALAAFENETGRKA